MKQPDIYIYIVQSHNGLVKIGHSIDPILRVRTINLHSPVPCRLAAMWIGRRKDEFALHRRFEAYRLHNEWFSDEGELAAFVFEKQGVGLGGPVLDWLSVSHQFSENLRETSRRRQSASMKAVWADPVRKEKWAASIREGQQRRRIKTAAMVPAVLDA